MYNIYNTIQDCVHEKVNVSLKYGLWKGVSPEVREEVGFLKKDVLRGVAHNINLPVMDNLTMVFYE